MIPDSMRTGDEGKRVDSDGGRVPPVPEKVAAVFPRLDKPDSTDLEIIARQIGREPRGTILVACRCPHGSPAVILTVPSMGGNGPLPPLLWLSCPSAATGAGRLEGEGRIRAYSTVLKDRSELNELFLEDEERFSCALKALADCLGSLALRFQDRGAAGGSKGAVKCLHAHLAYRLAAGRGVLGELCMSELNEKGGIWCERAPETCLT